MKPEDKAKREELKVLRQVRETEFYPELNRILNLKITDLDKAIDQVTEPYALNRLAGHRSALFNLLLSIETAPADEIAFAERLQKPQGNPPQIG